MSEIAGAIAREVLDSRGNPTVEAEVTLRDGTRARGIAPSGASTGANEAVELRDGDPSRFDGRGVLQAIDNVRNRIAPALSGLSAFDQAGVDGAMIELDGTHDRSGLGGNAMVAVSMAVARAASRSRRMPLYRCLGDGPPTLPMPMFNVLNGGKHAAKSTDVQEFMVVPSGLSSFRHALRAGAEVYHALGSMLKGMGHTGTVGDEGGFAPSGISNREALEMVLRAIEEAGYRPGEDCWIAVDVAASELLTAPGRYELPREGTAFTSDELIDTYERWRRDFPIVSIEDGLDESDWAGWGRMTSRLGEDVQIVGDDVYATSPDLIRKGIRNSSSNAVLVKMNQIGTITETLEAIRLAKSAGWGAVISHRSGETEDTTVADLAVGTAAGQIKAGAPSRGERTAKYNRLLRIEEELGDAGHEAYAMHDRA